MAQHVSVSIQAEYSDQLAPPCLHPPSLPLFRSCTEGGPHHRPPTGGRLIRKRPLKKSSLPSAFAPGSGRARLHAATPPPQTCTRRVRAGRPRPCGPDRCFPRAGRAEAGAIAIFGRQGLVCPQLGTSAPPPGPPAARSSWARPPSGLRANSLDRRGGEGAARREESPIFLPSLTMLGRLLGVHPARLQPMTRELLAGGGSVAGVRRG